MKEKLQKVIDERVELKSNAEVLAKTPAFPFKEAYQGQDSLLFVVIPMLKNVLKEEVPDSSAILTDLEITEGARNYLNDIGSVDRREIVHYDFTSGAKWYRWQIEQRQHNNHGKEISAKDRVDKNS